MSRALAAALLAACALLVADCAGEAGASADFYNGAFWYEDPWYVGGACCLDDIGPPPPRPEHPIATPPDVKPSRPIATPTPSPMPSPRPMAMPRGGGRR